MNERGACRCAQLAGGGWNRVSGERAQHPVGAAAFGGFGGKLVAGISGGRLRGPGVGSKRGCLARPALDRPAQQLGDPAARRGRLLFFLRGAGGQRQCSPSLAVGGPPRVLQLLLLLLMNHTPAARLGRRGQRPPRPWSLGHSARGEDTREARPRFPHPDTRGCALHWPPQVV